MSPQPEGADAGVGSDAGAVEMADMGDLNAPDAAEGGPVDGGELPPDGSIPDENPDEGGTCDRVGFNPRLTETALMDFGLQHIAIEGNYENFVITRIFEDSGGPNDWTLRTDGIITAIAGCAWSLNEDVRAMSVNRRSTPMRATWRSSS